MDYNASYGIDITSPELTTTDKAHGAETLKVLTETFEKMLSFNLFDPKSIAEALVVLTKEHAEVEITALTEDELEEQTDREIADVSGMPEEPSTEEETDDGEPHEEEPLNA